MKCPNCDRNIVNINFRRVQGCKYCVPEVTTEYCDGFYSEKDRNSELCRCSVPTRRKWFYHNLEICAKCLGYLLGY